MNRVQTGMGEFPVYMPFPCCGPSGRCRGPSSWEFHPSGRKGRSKRRPVVLTRRSLGFDVWRLFSERRAIGRISVVPPWRPYPPGPLLPPSQTPVPPVDGRLWVDRTNFHQGLKFPVFLSPYYDPQVFLQFRVGLASNKLFAD